MRSAYRVTFANGAPAAVALAVLVALVFRRIDVFEHPRLWAEDGSVFFADAIAYGPLATLLRPYAGYVHLVPRTIADVGSLLPIAWIPRFYATVAFLLDALCCSLFTLTAFRFLIRSDMLRAAVCIAIALAPGTNELIGNIANLQWYLVLGVFLAVAIPADVSRAWSARTIAALSTMVFLAVGSAPECLVVVPFVVVKLRDRAGLGRPLAAAFLIASLLQIWAFAHVAHGTVSHVGARDLTLGLIIAAALRGAVVPLAGPWCAQWLSLHHVVLTSVAILTALAVLLLLSAKRLSNEHRVHLAAIVYVGAASMLLALTVRGFVLAMLLHRPGVNAHDSERYFATAEFAFVIAVAMCIGTLPKIGSLRATALLLAIFSQGAIANFHGRPFPTPYRDWRPDAERVGAWKDASHRRLAQAPRVALPIVPAGWMVRLPPRPSD